ncbi:hypothetical protein AJ78_01462 [Emergomyces pasteurianus Ep9510]|uniref:RRM domain-containing protein n=1 Tax=Emergomyces pasteurianus Ep9510 TaxID=1447872 RepID=A0A1J9PRK4_9EURO|nr:hypothetical protein AJ78_01462 [Emergomyces pasteurianus Ep9510]
MTSNIPDEVLHIRGKTLTPESPRPLHISESSNIPLLQNQMDPAFSDSPVYKQIFLEKTPPLDTESVVSEQVRVTTHTYSMLHHNFGSLGSNGVRDHGSVSFSGPLDMGYPKTNTENESTFPAAHRTVAPSQSAYPALETSIFEMNHQQVAPPSTTSIVPEISSPLDRSIPSENNSSEPYYPPSTFPGSSHVSGPNDPATEYNPASVADDKKCIESEANPVLEGDSSYQNPLNTLSEAKSTAPSPKDIAGTTASNDDYMTEPLTADTSLPPSAGLPPRPPPQDKAPIHPSYGTTDNAQSFHSLPNQPGNGSTQYGQNNYSQSSGLPSLIVPTGAPGTSSTLNGLPPPPTATFQKLPQLSSNQIKPGVPKFPRSDRLDDEELKFLRGEGDREEPWAPDVQKKYDEFLYNERVYVTEGLWDRFSPGSRLFVGNLPTERVTKRDLFHIFHKYGELAQISIKQAYGFIQFLEPASCRKALEAEEGGYIRGRKIHLEISKPQKLTRNAPAPGSSRPPVNRRSRSPEPARGVPSHRGIRSGSDRYDRAPAPGRPPPAREFRGREEPYRRRDDYRPARTPSPRGNRRNDHRFRDRTPEDYERRRDRRHSRSPYGRQGRHRSSSPRERDYDNDSDLPIPRRSARQVPDVQIIVLENVDRDFVYHIENSFRDQGLRTDVLILSPRISLTAVIRRQIIEGVLAIVKLSRPNQYSGKVPLQVFDRTGGIDNVKFNEYSELEVNVAAEVVLHARTIHPGNASKYPSTQTSGVSQMLPAPSQISRPQPSSLGSNNNITNLISNLDGPALQSLLAALQHNPVAFQAAQQHYAPQGNPTDLASILNNFSRQQNSLAPPPPSTQQAPASTYGFPSQFPGARSNTNLASLLAQTLGGPPTGQSALPPSQITPQVPPHVQSIMDQLIKWKQ